MGFYLPGKMADTIFCLGRVEEGRSRTSRCLKAKFQLSEEKEPSAGIRASG